MRLLHLTGPAALLAASVVYGQTPPTTSPPMSPAPKNPTTGGTQPTPTSPATGGKAPPTVVFPTTGGTQPAPTSPATGGKAPSTPTVTFPTDLFRMNEVSRSVDLTDRQLNQLNLMTERLQTTYRQQFERLAGLPEQERADRAMLLNREYTNAWITGATDVLSPQQLTRYQQLQTQFGGFVSLTDPVVQRALSLTDAQIARLGEQVTWSDQQLAAIRQQAATDQARALQMFNAFNEAAQQRFNRLLTLEQQRAWAQLTGDPFVFPPPFPMPPPATTGGVPPKQ